MKSPFTYDDFLQIEECMVVFSNVLCEDHLKERFKEFDKDNNGFLSGEELEFVVAKYGEYLYNERFERVNRGALLKDYSLKDKNNKKLAQKLVPKILKEFDKDRNDKIDIEEFKKIFTRVSIIYLFENGDDYFKLNKEDFKKFFKMYVQFVKEFSQKVTVDMIKETYEKKEGYNIYKEGFEKNSPYIFYKRILSIRALTSPINVKGSGLEPSFADLNGKIEDGFEKIKEYANLVEKHDKFFDDIL